MPIQTGLYDRHVALGGRMVEYAGFMLPVQYPAGPKAEHLRVRHAAGLFDIDHMGQVEVRGPDALAFLQHVLTADVASFAPGSANYALLCYADGTVVDDTFVYVLDDHYLVVINASNNAKDTRWLRAHRGDFDVEIENVSAATYMLALQGPAAQAVIQPLCDAALDTLTYHCALSTPVAGVPMLIGRTGYTGEDGFEIYFPADQAVAVWDAIMASGARYDLLPIGLAARDSLRFEAAMPLYGQEISAERTPLAAGLGWAVGFGKPAFLGREALWKARLEGEPERLAGLRMTAGGVPRHGYRLLVDGRPCGEVTSGMYAPSLEQFLAMAYLPRELSAAGTAVEVEIRGRAHPAVVVPRPFYRPAYRR